MGIYFSSKEIKQKINILPISATEIVSIGISLIPFVEHDDANRAFMGTSMQRQAVIILKTMEPIVRTGTEETLVINLESNIYTNTSSIIKFSSKKKIILHKKIICSDKYFYDQNYFSNSFVKKKKSKLKKVIYSNYIKETVYFTQNKKLTIKKFKEKKEILNHALGVSKGKLSTGQNVLLAYLPFNGYNFEDAVIISDRLIKEDIFTSLNFRKIKTFVIKNETGEVRKFNE
jgi:DNA-directed RNA polymerase subunit beta